MYSPIVSEYRLSRIFAPINSTIRNGPPEMHRCREPCCCGRRVPSQSVGGEHRFRHLLWTIPFLVYHLLPPSNARSINDHLESTADQRVVSLLNSTSVPCGYMIRIVTATKFVTGVHSPRSMKLWVLVDISLWASLKPGHVLLYWSQEFHSKSSSQSDPEIKIALNNWILFFIYLQGIQRYMSKIISLSFVQIAFQSLITKLA